MFCYFQCEHNKECVTCDSDNWDCYLVDSNGWIVVSQDVNQTGMFFGKVRFLVSTPEIDLLYF